MKCEYCDNEIPQQSTRCPSCGAIVPQSSIAKETIVRNARNIVGADNGWVKMQTDNVVHDSRLDDIDDAMTIRRYRWVYVLLAIFLGGGGVHNYYAGHIKCGIAKIMLSVICLICFEDLFCLIGHVISYLWALIEAVAVRRDADGGVLL